MPNAYQGKAARLATDFDRWLARAQYREKHSQHRRVERMFGEIEDFDARTRHYDPVEERYLTEEEM